MRRLLRTLLALLFVSLSATANAQDIPVFVHSAPPPNVSTGFTDRESERYLKQREDSVRDIKKALNGKRNIRVVESPEEARIKVEVAGRSDFTFNVFSGNDEPIVIHARLTADNYSLDIIGRPSAVIRPGWKGAAENVAREIEDWVKMNRERLKSRAN